MSQSIAFTAYPVSDMTRARALYGQTLGLRLDSNYQNRWVEYDLAGATLALTTVLEGRAPGARGAMVGLEVENLEACPGT